MPSPDPWTALLDWLATIIVPDWSELVSMLPLFVLVGVVGPLVTLIVLMWLWHLVTRRRARVRVGRPQAVTARLDASGVPVLPPNTPYCTLHGLLYPPDRVTCEIDGAALAVRCPVDDTVRPAADQVCRACGTRYVLGASGTPLLVERTAGPPPEGAAVA